MSAGMPVPGPHSAAAGLSGSIADGKANDDTEALSGTQSPTSSWAQVETLAALLEPEAFNPDQPADETWREVTQQRALGHAAKIITSSDWVRVVEDDDTIERLARALAEQDRWNSGSDYVTLADDELSAMARAVVRALRDGGAE